MAKVMNKERSENLRSPPRLPVALQPWDGSQDSLSELYTERRPCKNMEWAPGTRRVGRAGREESEKGGC